jgi:hypothetical protein
MNSQRLQKYVVCKQNAEAMYGYQLYLLHGMESFPVGTHRGIYIDIFNGLTAHAPSQLDSNMWMS